MTVDLQGRVMALDYGTKRTGVAVTDPLRIICTPLKTVETPTLMSFLEDYFTTEYVSILVIGQPLNNEGLPTRMEDDIRGLIKKVKQKYPTLQIERIDESFSSSKAQQIIFQSGAKRKKRQDKSLIDKISAAVILQEYMERLS